MQKEVTNSKEKCPRCAKGKLVTDNESGEMFCSKCGFVLTEKLQEYFTEFSNGISPLSEANLLERLVAGRSVKRRHVIWELPLAWSALN